MSLLKLMCEAAMAIGETSLEDEMKAALEAILPYLRTTEPDQKELVLEVGNIPVEGIRVMEPHRYSAIHIIPSDTMPVMSEPVSLAKCINAAAEVDKEPFVGYRSIAIAILTIAGVPYVD